MEDWGWVTPVIIAVGGAASSGIAYAAFSRVRFLDRRERLTLQLQHLFDADIPCDLRLIRKTTAPPPPWYLLRVVWSIIRRKPLFRATIATYEPIAREVMDVTFEWKTCATATDMYNRVYESSEALPTRCEHEYPDGLAWHSSERGCIVWIERVFPKPGKKLPKWFRNESESLKKPPSTAVDDTPPQAHRPARRLPPPGLRRGRLSVRRRRTALVARACDERRAHPKHKTPQRSPNAATRRGRKHRQLRTRPAGRTHKRRTAR